MKLLILQLIVLFSLAYSNTVNNVRLLQHRTYILKVIEETVHDLERMGWCNLKIPEISSDLSFSVFGRNVTGSVTYKNGFLTQNQHIDVVESTIAQIWTYDREILSGIVSLQGQMRMHDVVLGFDVDAVLDDEPHHYTSKFLHRLFSFNFVIRTTLNTNATVVTVEGIHPTSSNRMSYMPNDEYTDWLGAQYDAVSTRPAVLAWATDVFQPIAENVVANKVEFPTICYNCPAS